MKNIIWQKPDGGFAVTSLADPAADSAANAVQLKAAGAIPADWVVHAVDMVQPPRSVPEVKAAKLAQLEAARKAAETAQVTVQGKPFPGTDEFQAKIGRALNYIGRAKPLDPADAWRDSNAAPVAMNATLLGQIEDAITAQGVAAWKKYWLLFDAVMAAQDAATIDAVTW